MPTKTKKTDDTDKYEIWTVSYQTPKFGCEGEFNKDIVHMLVASYLGRDDATETCRRFHRGCRIICTLNRLEYATGLEQKFINKTMGAQ